ncbi:hypothetical protein [Mycobacterium xenopi]|uniref:Uncharacterized protein n=2 Tax=Mycobacterium xenopi TaxID=1789 RepID=A0AAD1M2E3_MYCXE|nr:hypothetical protein [Mycobacterium xenopi]EUA34420.1 hypothetical protein I552_5203 [Mycobacterium xenopi 3993]EUA54799.1 hypothetical protein I553_1395 [Mycobacterium xenopi 4042]MDA3642067.1 hypothetical protein [Mycobacterium xenopi]MDA3659950.1 hypothetical protein [Mycobacterium xenopi]MDA3664499.1 hypothetical protein [Mycobacterium xenopi]
MSDGVAACALASSIGAIARQPTPPDAVPPDGRDLVEVTALARRVSIPGMGRC